MQKPNKMQMLLIIIIIIIIIIVASIFIYREHLKNTYKDKNSATDEDLKALGYKGEFLSVLEDIDLLSTLLNPS